MLLTWFWEIVKIFSAFTFSICGALRDLVLFVQFKKREKHDFLYSPLAISFLKGVTHQVLWSISVIQCIMIN